MTIESKQQARDILTKWAQGKTAEELEEMAADIAKASERLSAGLLLNDKKKDCQ